MRSVPDHIDRPDYAGHPDGYPASERAARGSTNIVQLSDEDQEQMRVAGRVSAPLSFQARGMSLLNAKRA